MSLFSLDKIHYFLDIAKQQANNSFCLRAQVGAIIVNNHYEILSTGYNTPPIGVKNSQEIGFCNKEKHNFKSGEGYHTCRSIHAEQYAILKLGIEKTQDTTMFVFGHQFVCHFCRQYIVMAGIKTLYLKYQPSSDFIKQNPQDWLEELQNPQHKNQVFI